MAATAQMPAESRTLPSEQFKPRQAAKQHMQYLSSSPKEPFDADLLTRKLESYRQELKLERARRQLTEQKGNNQTIARSDSGNTLPSVEKKTMFMLPSFEKKPTKTVSDPERTGSGIQRSKSLNITKTLKVPEQPERKRSLIHRRSKQAEPKEDDSSSGPYIPRFAAKQFKSTTTPIKKKESSDMKSNTIKDTGLSKPKLDWTEPLPKFTAAAQAASAEAPIDAPIRRAALLSIQNSSNLRPRPMSTALDNLRICETEHNPYILSSAIRQPHHTQPPESSPLPNVQNRPHLKHDRHDWSQASQTGDSARASLHLRRKDVIGENAELAGLKAGRGKPRQKSHGDTPDGLVNEAVRLIREEKRRSSIFGVLKRRH